MKKEALVSIRKINIWGLGCIFVLAVLIYIGLNYLTSYILSFFPSLLSSIIPGSSWYFLMYVIFIIVPAFLLGLILALIYNLLSRWCGGIKIKISEKR